MITLGWSREKLAEKAGVAAESVKRSEFHGNNPKLGTVNKWHRALEAGVEFIDNVATSFEGGPVVRLRGAKRKR